MRTSLIAVAAVVLSSNLSISSPRITSVLPPALAPGPAAQLITVNGDQFLPGLSLDISTPGGGTRHFQGADIQSPRASSFQVAMAFDTAGTYSFVVTNPDGGVCDPFPLKVQAPMVPPVAAPVVDGVSPTRATKQPDVQVLKVDGKRFVDGLVVNLSDPTGETTTITGADVRRLTSTSFEVSVVLNMSGDYQIGVTNPDGARSNMVTISVMTRAR